MRKTAVYIARGLDERPSAGTDIVVFSDVMPFVGQESAGEYLMRCRDYAVRHRVYLVPARFVLRGFLCMCLMSPSGAMAGIQRAAHLNLSLAGAAKRADEISVIQTKIGKIFLCVDTDIYHPEVLRAAKLTGAQIVVSSQYIDERDYTHEHLVSGAVSASASNFVYVVNVAGHHCSITAPRVATHDGSGFVLRPELPHGTGADIYPELMDDAISGCLPSPDFPRFALGDKYFNTLSS